MTSTYIMQFPEAQGIRAFKRTYTSTSKESVEVRLNEEGSTRKVHAKGRRETATESHS